MHQNSKCAWSVHFTSRVINPQNIKIGKCIERSFLFSGGCYIQGNNGIEIGDGTILGTGVNIIRADHDLNRFKSWLAGKPIKICKKCWMGANTIILHEVDLGDRVIKGTGAIFIKSLPFNVVIGGNPTRIIKII